MQTENLINMPQNANKSDVSDEARTTNAPKVPENDPELAQVLATWPTLSPAIRQAIASMAKASAGK